MLSTGYVWIATDWLSYVLDSGLLEADNMKSLQGVISLRPHTPNSGQQRVFRERWKDLQTDNMVNVSLNSFGLYAYDSILNKIINTLGISSSKSSINFVN